MAPTHVITFQKFTGMIHSHLEASIAFGLFMESERQWAARSEGNHSDGKYRNYQASLTNHEIGRYATEARSFLRNFGDEAVAEKQTEFVKASLMEYEKAAKSGHSKFRGWGILEAILGALVWTFVLITISFVLKYNGIDLFEVYHKVSGH